MPDVAIQPGARGTLVTFTVIRKAPAAFALSRSMPWPLSISMPPKAAAAGA